MYGVTATVQRGWLAGFIGVTDAWGLLKFAVSRSVANFSLEATKTLPENV